MRQSCSLNIDGYEAQPWDKQTDKCVYDYIIHTYGKIKGFKKVRNYETISEVFGDDECFPPLPHLLLLGAANAGAGQLGGLALVVKPLSPNRENQGTDGADR